MFGVVLFRYLCLGVIFYTQLDQCVLAAVPRPTRLRVQTSVLRSVSSMMSGDKARFNLNVAHEKLSKVKAVDAHLQIKFPLYLVFNSYETATGVVPTSVDNTSTTFNFKFSEIPLAQSISLTIIVDVDPYFMHVSRETVYLSTDVDFWYYGEDGPCARPTSYYNANHEQRSWIIEFLASKACEQRINTTLGAPLQAHQYFASSVTPGNEAHLASLSNPGVWVPASSYASDRNQFLQIDFERLVRVTKIATRGTTKPKIAFVRSYHLYYSNNLIEWSGYQENHKLKMFSGNTDGRSLVASSLPLPINTQYIRIVPRAWKTKRALELQVHGCPVHPVATLADYCPLFDFESALTGWSKTGTAFDNQPTIGDNLRARTGQSANIQGNGWIATAENRRLPYLMMRDTQGDEPTGTLTSPKFYIASSKLYFLIGGTQDSTKARAELLVDGVVVRTASGDGESLTEKVWNVEEFLSKEAVLHLVDDATDGHINFDALRIDCHLEADAKNITLPMRSMLLNPSTHSLYVCESTHLNHKDDSRCKMTSNNIDKWIDVPDVLGILGVDKSLNKLYAVSNDRHVLVSLRNTGREWRYITRSEWDEAELMPTMLLVRDVIWKSSIEGVADDVLEILNDDNGEKWKATSSDISFKGLGQTWTAIASWFCQDIAEDPCVSEPCQYSAKCVNPSPGQYKCICLAGYTGVNCDVNIDDCANHDCLNGASCRDGINNFACICKYGYGGKKCDRVLSGCRSFPCLNRGTCADLGSGNFKCTCSAKYRGTLCEIAINKCESFPCKNSGKCIPEYSSYKCLCHERYYGTNCESVRHSHFTVVSTKTITSTNDYLVIKATIPSHGQSLWSNWCEEYKKLCASQGGWFPTGLGGSYNHIKHHSSCRYKYDSIMDPDDILGATPNTKVAELAQNAGFSNARSNNSFAFNMCSEGNCSKTLPLSGCHGALSCISQTVPNYEVYTVCTVPCNSNFKIYHSGWTTYNGLHLLILSVKAKSSYSKHENWCRDYEKLCQSYGLRPTTYSAGLCQDKYNSLVLENFDRTAVRYAGNQVKPSSNAFNFRDCSRCSSVYSSNYNALYHASSTSSIYNTACAHPQDVGLQVLDEKTVEYDGAYLVLKAQVREGGFSKRASWCQDIQSLCESYGHKPVGCGECSVKYQSVVPGKLSCPPSAAVIAQIANNAGFSEAKDTNSFVLNKCGRCSGRISEGACGEEFFCLGADNPHQVVYTVCYRAPVHAFEVLDTKWTNYASVPYLVIKTRLPSDKKYRSQNWCQDYQRLCENYRTKPTGCGSSYAADSTYSSCRDSYGAVMPSDDHLGCGNTSVVYKIANKAGFVPANSRNTFVFHQCLSSYCTTDVTYGCRSTCSCHSALGCIHSTTSPSYREAYAICVGTGGGTAFEVLETKATTSLYGDDVFVVKARLPSNGVAAYGNWCEDYRQLCLAYGWRPTGCGAEYSHKLEYVTCRSRYQSVMSESPFMTCPPNHDVSTIANWAGFTNASKENSFAFSDCTSPCVNMLTVGNSFINVSAVNSEVYTICVSSNSNFKVFSNHDVNYNGGQYLFVEAEVPQSYKSKHSDWCTDYMRMCESYGLRPVGLNGKEGSSGYSSCIKKYSAVNPMNSELNTQSNIRAFGNMLGYYIPSSGSTFVLNYDCPKYCYADISKFGSESYSSLDYLRTNTLSSFNYKVYTVCSSSDSNFHVLSTNNFVSPSGQDYLVVMVRLPSHRESKYDTWCKDYERLCRTFKMRPTGCGIEYQWSSKHRSCVEKFQSAMAESGTLRCNSSESVAEIANMAGFPSAFANNSFVFHQCSEFGSCPRKLTRDCAEGLSCLHDQQDVVYTLCTDSASAFRVENVQDTNDKNLPLLLIGSTLPDSPQPKNENWCADYQKLCESFAARPVGCDSTDHPEYELCSTKFNALNLKHSIQGCDDNGKYDISYLVDITPTLDNGEYFKFSKCKLSRCQSPVKTDKCHGALYCLKAASNFLYTTCSRSSNNFVVLSMKWTSYEEVNSVVVIEASVPSNGKSLHDTWCHDYEKVCSIYGRQPLACSSRADYIQDWSAYRSCRSNFNGYMLKNSALPCPLNDMVAQIAQNVGFLFATPTNSLAFSTCTSCAKNLNFVKNITSDTLSLSLTSCPPGAVCSNWTSGGLYPGSNNVYLLCVKPPQVSSFVVKEIRKASYLGQKFSVFRLTVPHDGKSLVGDWCADYHKLCASVSMRPIGCGSGHERVKMHRDCRLKYNAVMPKGFTCPPYDSVRYIVRKTGFPDDPYRTFGMYSCSDCSGDIKSSSLSRVQLIDTYLYTACSNSDSAFEVIETRNVVVAKTSFMVIKAQLPVDMLSSHENWCKDYQNLCESYGKRPLTCSEGCSRSFYNTLSVSSLNCGDVPNLKTIPQAANFSQANDFNTFVLQSCGSDECTRRVSSIGCSTGGLDCMNSALPNRAVYTMCISSTTAYDVIATKAVTYSSRNYLTVRVKMPNDYTSRYYSWCHDYREMCKEYGYRPLACNNYRCIDFHGALWMTSYPCPIGYGIGHVASLAGMDFVTDDTNFAYYSSCFGAECKKVAYFENCTDKLPLNCYDRKLNDGEFTTICTAAETHFPVLDYKTVRYSGREYLVVRTRKQEPYSKKSNWCYDYQELCRSFRMSPLACSAKQRTNHGYHDCKRNFLAVMMENVDHGCPLNDFVAELANLAGFPAATPANSFAFKNCSSAHCRNVVAEEDCGEAFGCLNKESKDLYTVCAGYDTGFKVLDYDTTVTYNSTGYAVIQVVALNNQNSLHEDWCRDYQRLCESFDRHPVACYNADDLKSPDVCGDSYGASRMIPCGSTAYNIAAASGLPRVTSESVIFMHKCTDCPNILSNACADNLNCASADTFLHAICANKATISAGARLNPLQTIPLTYGFRSFLAVQIALVNYYDYDWRDEYINLCTLYGYVPIGCGKTASDASSEINYCRTQYNILSSEGDDFSCPPSETTAILARKAGFYEANNMNSFGFYKCSASYSSSYKYLPNRSCYARVWCLTRYPPRNIMYTMCAKPLPTYTLGFQVLDKKKTAFLHTSYLAVKVQMNVDGKASLDNWCYEYRELCRQFDMVPTGCGREKESESAYSACKTKYNSFMPYSDILTCKNNKLPVTIVRSAGFRDANIINTFVFNRCDQCGKYLSGTGCNGALNCLHKNVWEKIAYTLCVERLSGFEVLRSTNVVHGSHELTVVQAALPKDARAVHENWCQDYQKLCYSFGKFPVACAIDANTPDVRKYSQRYGAVILDNIPCSPVSTLVNIATTAGYSQATSKNTFAFAAHSDAACPQYMPAAGCTAGLDCINSKERLVYTVCTNPTNIEVSDVVTTTYLGNTFTVIKARLPATGLSKASTWCEEYANLCRALKQQPVACQSIADSIEYQKCVHDYDAYPLSDKYNCLSVSSSLHEIAQVAGFTDATFGNTFGIKACSAEKCKQQIHSGPDCDASLNCVNSKLPNRQVYALCIKDGEISNFKVQETKKFAKSNVQYLAIRALVSSMGISKHESWCKDYEKMCQAYEMRPIRCSPQQNQHCLGEFNALGTSKEKLDCTDNAKLVEFVKYAGFEKSSPENTFILGSCESSKLCRKTLDSSQCDGSLNCLKRLSGNREVYTVCGRSTATSFAYVEARTTFYEGSNYLVIKTAPASHGFSTTEDWCYDYRDMCASFGKRPMVEGALSATSVTKKSCFTIYNGTASAVSQSKRTLVAFAAGFDPGQCAQLFKDCGKCFNTMRICPFASCQCSSHMYLLCL